MTGASTIRDAFAATVAANADEPALRTPDGVIDWTWREYAERVESTARALAGIGVRPKDRAACGHRTGPSSTSPTPRRSGRVPAGG